MGSEMFFTLVMKRGVLQSPPAFPDHSNTGTCCPVQPCLFCSLEGAAGTGVGDPSFVCPHRSACPGELWVTYQCTPLLQAIAGERCQAPADFWGSATPKCSCENTQHHMELQVASILRWDASILRRCSVTFCHVLSESRRQHVNVTLHEHESCLWDVGTNCGCLMRWGWPGSVCLCYKHWSRVSEWSLGRNLQREASAKSQQRGCRKHSVDLTGRFGDEQPNAQASSLPSQPSLQASSAHSCPFPPSKSFLTFPSSFSWLSFHFADSSVTSKPQA